MTEKELEYREALALLPAYAAGQLDHTAQTAVDDYLQRQIALFRHLDELEVAAGRADAPSAYRDTTAASPQVDFGDEDPFTQVMEGQVATQQIAGNPMLMRTAPQTYVDERSGQRFVVPRPRMAADGAAPRDLPNHGRPNHGRPNRWGRAIWRTLWGLFALATVAAVILIALYQRNLQQAITAAQTQLRETQQEMAIVSSANRALSLRSADRALQGTLMIRGNQALLSISGLGLLPATAQYQLWLRISDGQTVAAGQLPATEPQATRWLTVDLPVDGGAVVGAGLSIEPTDGSAQPTTPMIVESAP